MSPTSKKSFKKELLDYPFEDMDQDDSNSNKSQSSSSRQYGRVNRLMLDKNSDEYRKRREKNNLAVKRSRNKSKQKTEQTVKRVEELKAENAKLESKVNMLSKELDFLKNLFLEHAGSSHNGQLELNLGNGSHEPLNNNNNNNNANNSVGEGPINAKLISSSAIHKKN